MTFKTARNLHLHSVRHEEKTIQCPECPKTFNNPIHYRSHYEIHLNLQYKCINCNVLCKTKRGLSRHMRKLYRVHSVRNTYLMILYSGKHRTTVPEKKFACPQCSLKFHARFVLENHMRSHTGEKRK